NNFRYIILIIFFTLYSWLGITQNTDNGQPFFTNYTPEEYNAHIQTWDIGKDSRGIVYAANVDGLLEYDGNDWNLHPLPEDATGRSLDFDREGRVFFGTNESFGYFEPLENGKLTYISLSDSFKIKGVSDVWNTTVIDSNVFYRTYNHVYVYNGDTVKTFSTDEDSRFLTDFECQGNYYLLNLNTGLFKYNKHEKFESSDQFSALNKFQPSAIKCFNDTSLIFISRDSLFGISHNNYVWNFSHRLDSLLNAAGSYYGIECTGSEIIIGTLTSGIVIYNYETDTFRTIDDKEGLQGETVYAIEKDEQNNLWLALSNGISRIEFSFPVTFWGKEQGLNAYVTDIISYNEKIFLTTENGIFYLEDGELNKFKEMKDQSWGFEVFGKDERNKMLLAGTNDGLLQIEGNNLRNLYEKGTNIVTSLYYAEDLENILFLGLSNGVAVLEYNEGEFEETDFYYKQEDDVRSIARDSSGVFWFATFRNGVFKGTFSRKENKLHVEKHFNKDDGFPSLKNINVYPYKERVVFGTEEGIYKYDNQNDTVKIDSTFGAYFLERNKDVFAFQEGVKDKVYATGLENKSSPVAWGILDESGQYKWQNEPFLRLPEMMVLSLYEQNDSVLWIGGSKGLFKYNFGDYDTGTDLHTMIREVVVNQDSTLFFGNLPLKLRENANYLVQNSEPIDYKYNSITFRYSLPFYDNEDKNKYQFYLEGFDDDWSGWETTNFKQYTNLPEGEYTFRVRAKNVYGKVSGEAQYNFSVKPPWSRTWYAYLGYLILFSLIVWLIIRLYTANLKAANIKLEAKVKERTSEIEQQKEEIRQQRDSIYNQAKQLELINAELKKLSIAARETDNAMLLMDRKGRIEWINEGFTRLYGYSIIEIRDKYKFNPIKYGDLPELKRHFNKVIQEKTSYIYESQLKAKNGEIVFAQTTLTPIIDDFGEVAQVISVDSDIRKIKEAEKELKKLNATKDKFFSIIAHDLKNPFHSLLGATQTLIRKIDQYDKEKILFFLENMEDVAKRGYDLLVNLLEWSRSQTGRLEFTKENINLHNIVESSANLLNGNAKNKSVKILNNVDEKIEVAADRNTISTVLRNLISNAIKYSNKGDIVKIYTEFSDSVVHVHVEDTGMGIKPEYLDKLFRIDESYTTKGTKEESGTGLGLILCKEFVEKNGGKIYVSSEIGAGSTFSFTLQRP
ncbi:MAG: ATP-binding protein, partial [Bacteroidota bacterium]